MITVSSIVFSVTLSNMDSESFEMAIVSLFSWCLFYDTIDDFNHCYFTKDRVS